MGSVASIHVAPEGGAEMVEVQEARAVPGRGLEGDRYFRGSGTYSKKAASQVTLIEAEAIEALHREYGIAMQAKETRRNIAVRGVALNHLVGREFTVGSVRLRGTKLCEPCGHMERLSGKKAMPGLVHRGGLNCEVLAGGVIRVGDPVDLGSDSPRSPA